jgi:HAD superfamily hydrolase (TIGR01509 family)
MPGLVESLLQARAPAVLLGVAAAAHCQNVEFVLQGISLRSAFDTIVTGDDISRGKPDPEIFLIAAQRLGVPPARCLVFEDSLMGIEAARRAGMDSVALTTTIAAKKVSGLTGVKLTAVDYSALNPATLAV